MLLTAAAARLAMPGPRIKSGDDPGIHVSLRSIAWRVDGRVKPGHDDIDAIEAAP